MSIIDKKNKWGITNFGPVLTNEELLSRMRKYLSGNIPMGSLFRWETTKEGYHFWCNGSRGVRKARIRTMIVELNGSMKPFNKEDWI